MIGSDNRGHRRNLFERGKQVIDLCGVEKPVGALWCEIRERGLVEQRRIHHIVFG